MSLWRRRLIIDKIITLAEWRTEVTPRCVLKLTVRPGGSAAEDWAPGPGAHSSCHWGANHRQTIRTQPEPITLLKHSGPSAAVTGDSSYLSAHKQQALWACCVNTKDPGTPDCKLKGTLTQTDTQLSFTDKQTHELLSDCWCLMLNIAVCTTLCDCHLSTEQRCNNSLWQRVELLLDQAFYLAFLAVVSEREGSSKVTRLLSHLLLK